MIYHAFGKFWYNKLLAECLKLFRIMITIINLTVSLLGVFSLTYIFTAFTHTEERNPKVVLQNCAVRKRIFVALAIFALVVLYQWLRV